MSDIYIPGVKSRFETETLIADLMKLERVPKERAQKNVETLEKQKTIWQDVGIKMRALRESARVLYSFQNPFNERVAASSDENVLTAEATREAREQVRSFTVKRIASADRFLSEPLPPDFRIGQGDYEFTVGEDSIVVPFRGGSIDEFADAVGRRGKGKLGASGIVVQPGTRSLVLEALVTGEANRLGFRKDAEKLALAARIVERIDDKERRPPLDVASLRAVPPASGPAQAASADGTLAVTAGGQARVPISPGVRSEGGMSLEFEFRSVLQAVEAAEDEGPPPGPTLPPTGSATYGGITIQSDPPIVPLPPWEPPVVPPRIDDPNLVRLSFADGSTADLPPFSDSAGFVRHTFRLADFGEGKTLSAIDLINRNTHRDAALRSLRIFDAQARGGLKPKNPISMAADAQLEMDGIEVKRPTNAVDDLIPGVKVTLREASDVPVKLKVEPDRKAAKEAVIALVGNYNKLVAETNVLTRLDDKVIRELDYLTDDERKTMEGKLGSLQGDSTLNQFRTTLQRAASTPYPTSAEKDLALLSQIGVSTDASRSGSGGGYDVSRLRGYLEIDEKKLDAALKDRLPAVRELFASDTDGDLINDTGFAFMVDTLTKSYVETGGILSLKTSGIDTRLVQEKRTVESLDQKLIAKESDLKRKYGLMEGALSRMERTSGSIDQFSKNSGQ